MRLKESFEANMANRRDEELTRAEKIRGRRQKDRKEPVQPPLGSSVTRKQTRRQVPVTQRRTYTPPVVNRKRGKTPVPIKSKGVEVHLPAIPRIQFGWRLVSGAVFLLSLIAVFSFASVGTFKVSKVNLKGAERLSGQAILSQVNIEGTAIIKIQPEEIEAQIAERFPSLSSVQVSTGFPAEVNVRVSERQPLMLWQQDGQSLWIDSDGVMFPVRGEADVPLTVIASSDPPSIQTPDKVDEDEEFSDGTEEISFNPELMGQNTFPRTTPEFVQSILLLYQHLPENTALQYNPEFGLGWQDPAGWLVYFGKNIKDMEIKLQEYKAIVGTMQEQNVTPTLISLEFLHAPFYRLEQ
ncbi:MAG: cell division protein FtsQ/DivIB [Brevefilum sp.]